MNVSIPKPKLDKLPFEDTEIPVEKSRSAIDKALVQAGAEGIRWSDRYRPRREAVLEFVKGGRHYQLAIPIHTDDLEKERRNIAPARFDEYMVRREQAMFRAMYHYVDAMTKAHKHGLVSFETAFIGAATLQLPNGEIRTVAEVVTDPRFDPSKALPAGKEEAVEVPYEIVKDNEQRGC